jgi:hypothetical protein
MRKLLDSAQQIDLVLHPDSTLDLVELDATEREIVADLRAKPVKLADLTRHPPDVLETTLFAALVTRQIVVPGQDKPPMGLRAAASVEPVRFPSAAPPKKKVSWSELLAVKRAPSTKPSEAPLTPRIDQPPSTPASPPNIEAIAMVRRAEQALSAKDIDGAKNIAERALALDRNAAAVRAFWAWVRMLSGELKPAVAIEEVDQALAIDQSCLPARLYHAKLLKREGRLHEAMRDLEMVLAAEPEHREAKNELRVLLLTLKPR